MHVERGGDLKAREGLAEPPQVGAVVEVVRALVVVHKVDAVQQRAQLLDPARVALDLSELLLVDHAVEPQVGRGGGRGVVDGARRRVDRVAAQGRADVAQVVEGDVAAPAVVVVEVVVEPEVVEHQAGNLGAPARVVGEARRLLHHAHGAPDGPHVAVRGPVDRPALRRRVRDAVEQLRRAARAAERGQLRAQVREALHAPAAAADRRGAERQRLEQRGALRHALAAEGRAVARVEPAEPAGQARCRRRAASGRRRRAEQQQKQRLEPQLGTTHWSRSRKPEPEPEPQTLCWR